jgi:hypothetical protein
MLSDGLRVIESNESIHMGRGFGPACSPYLAFCLRDVIKFWEKDMAKFF